MAWDKDLLEVTFRPAEVALITGYSQVLQRKWTERYFDFRRSALVVGGEAARRWYSWTGVQMLGVFGDVLSDLGSARHARAALMEDPVPGLTRSGIDGFASDYRHAAGSVTDRDLFMFCDLRADEPLFLRGVAETSANYERCYSYNISAMQRRLAARAEKLIEANYRYNNGLIVLSEYEEMLAGEPFAGSEA